MWLCFSAYCGGLWLASVCVMCKMARLVEDEAAYLRYRDILDRGSAAYDKLLWNGVWSSVVESSTVCTFTFSHLADALIWDVHALIRESGY